jgi:hypothetical protein
MVLREHEIPVAYPMVAMAAQGHEPHPMRQFMCCWAAFNNIYVTLAAQAGKRARLRYSPDGSVQSRRVAHVDVHRSGSFRNRIRSIPRLNDSQWD